ncbi:MAG: hypothetical protein KME19_06150 [Microcoleus vaginatus WJT46-NPBG5]|nr:hypothetical protein [Microcoleus vaginatus WJT46-NPBG5]
MPPSGTFLKTTCIRSYEGMGNGALGMGHWAWGIEHGALGMGHGAWGIGYGARLRQPKGMGMGDWHFSPTSSLS